MLFVYLLDTVSGVVHYRGSHALNDKEAMELPMSCTQFDNVVAYSFWNDMAESKHTQLVVLELFESSEPNVRTDSPSSSSFSSCRAHVESIAFTLPRPVTSLGFTRTLASISTRSLLVGFAGHQFMEISRRILDTRRPIKASNEDKEEGLVQYQPHIPIIPSNVLTYDKHIFGIDNIESVPSNLESTCITLTHGIDIFSTRVSPSQAFDVLDRDFSYSGVIATVVALMVAIFWIKRLVRLI